MLLRHCCRLGNSVAGFGNNVERNFIFSTNSKQIEHVQFVSTLSKGWNFGACKCRVDIWQIFNFISQTEGSGRVAPSLLWCLRLALPIFLENFRSNSCTLVHFRQENVLLSRIIGGSDIYPWPHFWHWWSADPLTPADSPPLRGRTYTCYWCSRCHCWNATRPGSTIALLTGQWTSPRSLRRPCLPVYIDCTTGPPLSWSSAVSARSSRSSSTFRQSTMRERHRPASSRNEWATADRMVRRKAPVLTTGHTRRSQHSLTRALYDFCALWPWSLTFWPKNKWFSRRFYVKFNILAASVLQISRGKQTDRQTNKQTNKQNTWTLLKTTVGVSNQIYATTINLLLL